MYTNIQKISEMKNIYSNFVNEIISQYVALKLTRSNLFLHLRFSYSDKSIKLQE